MTRSDFPSAWPVLAGVTSAGSRPVVRWAAAEAAAMATGLRLLTARPAAGDAAALALLAELAAEVTAERPNLPVTPELVSGPPAASLRAAAAAAELLVVGADDASPFVEAISGSVPGELLTTTPCPLAVVPRRERTTPATAPVVVAFAEPATSQAALAYAFGAAARSGRPLTVLHCVPADDATLVDPARGLVGFGGRYPDVTVDIEVTAAEPRTALVDVSRRAALLVLGSRGRGRLASGLFGSVSRDLIRRSACPVVVARATAGTAEVALTS